MRWSEWNFRNATITVPLKYLGSSRRSLEIPLINCKRELKRKWTYQCVLSADGNDKTDANPNNFIFTMKDKEFYVPVVKLSKEN